MPFPVRLSRCFKMARETRQLRMPVALDVERVVRRAREFRGLSGGGFRHCGKRAPLNFELVHESIDLRCPKHEGEVVRRKQGEREWGKEAGAQREKRKLPGGVPLNRKKHPLTPAGVRAAPTIATAQV